MNTKCDFFDGYCSEHDKHAAACPDALAVYKARERLLIEALWSVTTAATRGQAIGRARLALDATELLA